MEVPHKVSHIGAELRRSSAVWDAFSTRPDNRIARLDKTKRSGVSARARVFDQYWLLLPDDHFLDENLTIDFQSKEVDPGSNVFSSLGVFPVPVCDE